MDGDKIYETVILPRALTAQIFKMAHDDLGHNGTHRTYMLLKRLYYWKGLKPSVAKHIQMAVGWCACDQVLDQTSNKLLVES